MYPELTERLSL